MNDYEDKHLSFSGNSMHLWILRKTEMCLEHNIWVLEVKIEFIYYKYRQR